MADQFNYDVFLSHSSQDKAIVRPLAERLREDGLRVWFDDWCIKLGDSISGKIEEGLEQSRVLVLCMSANAYNSDWTRMESYAFQFPDPLNKERRVIPLRLDTAKVRASLAHMQHLNWLAEMDEQEREQSYAKLFGACRALRDLELTYLKWFKQDPLQNIHRYTYISGDYSRQPQLIEIACSLEPSDREAQPLSFVDAVEEILDRRRAVLLGEPGGGKTTILLKALDRLLTAAAADPAQPLPLYVPLGRWDQAGQSLYGFIADWLNRLTPGLGNHLDGLLDNRRAALLLDGLNELPVGQRADKYPAVKRFIQTRPDMLAVVACRKDDYPALDLGFDRIVIKPLDARQIRTFATNYLGPARGEELFWKLPRPGTRAYYDDFMARVGAAHEAVFWDADRLPPPLQWPYEGDTENKYGGYWDEWRQHRETPSSLMLLARNPYLLTMLTEVYDKERDLPQNRGALFARFVSRLLERERKREEISAAEQRTLLEKLALLGYTMQSQSDEAGQARTTLSRAEADTLLDARLLRLASSATLLDIGEQVRFTHQLLQEYFAAQHLKTIRATGHHATQLWPRQRWWERTNWEETAVLLAGLDNDDCSEVVEWIAEANPEVAAQCINRSGAHTPDATRIRLRDKWLPRLTDLKREPEPEARAALGRALGQIRVGNHPLDNRPGVSITSDGLPDIAWIEIPGGEFQYGAEKQADDPDWLNPAKPRPLKLPTFWISRYPITYAQFRCFAEDKGYGDELWWKGLAADEDDRQPGEQSFKFDNHPCDTVNWYEAIAFCRWLSWRWGGGYDLRKIDEWKVRLPTEFEWEKAARGTDGRLYPYQGEYDTQKANTEQTIGQTSAVGIYPQGVSPYGVEEMSGNVWEWCLSDYDKPQKDGRKEKLETNNTRVLRGGSWINHRSSARSVRRNFDFPGNRFNFTGFRVAVSRPPS